MAQQPSTNPTPTQKKIKKAQRTGKILSQCIWHIWFLPTHDPTLQKTKRAKPTHPEQIQELMI